MTTSHRAARTVSLVARNATGATGASRILLAHARQLVDAGYPVRIVAQTVDAKEIAATRAVLRKVPVLPFGNWWKRRAFAALAGALAGAGGSFVWGQGDDLQPDLLSLHNCVHLAHEHLHGRPLPADNAVGRFFELLFARRSFRHVIANSRLMADDVVRRFGVPADAVTVIHPGYDPDQFSPANGAADRAALRQRLGLAPGQPLLGLVTSGDFRKRGAATFLQMLAALKVPAHGLLVGREASLAPWQDQAEQLGLAGRVTFMPPSASVAAIYRGLDVLVHPAGFEEFGLVVQEAAVCGTPVVTSRLVGASELLQGLPGAEHYVLPQPQPEALAVAVERLLRDPDERERWARIGCNGFASNTIAADFERSLPVLQAAMQA
jgi:UDP-glucose:(heptosyl)LPS alpha-1,3-glucosyltransferase